MLATSPIEQDIIQLDVAVADHQKNQHSRTAHSWELCQKNSLVREIEFVSACNGTQQTEQYLSALLRIWHRVLPQPVVQGTVPDPETCELFELPGGPDRGETVTHYLDYSHVRRAAKLDPSGDPHPDADAGVGTGPTGDGDNSPEAAATHESLEELREVRAHA